jgi:hypothetical protein
MFLLRGYQHQVRLRSTVYILLSRTFPLCIKVYLSYSVSQLCMICALYFIENIDSIKIFGSNTGQVIT